MVSLVRLNMCATTAIFTVLTVFLSHLLELLCLSIRHFMSKYSDDSRLMRWSFRHIINIPKDNIYAI